MSGEAETGGLGAGGGTYSSGGVEHSREGMVVLLHRFVPHGCKNHEGMVQCMYPFCCSLRERCISERFIVGKGCDSLSQDSVRHKPLQKAADSP